LTCISLSFLASTRLNGRAHDNPPTLRARDRTLDQYRTSRLIDPYDLKVLCGPANGAHVSRHPLSLEHTSWRLILTD
jgi:hypothetical protein